MTSFWLVIRHDRPGVAELRSKTRPAHRDYIWRRDLPARLITGSPLSTSETGDDMTGSWALLEAPDHAAVAAWIEGDPYTKVDLFDRVEICRAHKGFDLEDQLSRRFEDWQPPS